MILDYFKYLYLKITKKRIDYNLYLTTKHWKRVSEKVRKRSKNRCAICGSRNNTVIHHNSYDHLYAERSHELVCLCRRCHNTIHFYIWKPKQNRNAS